MLMARPGPPLSLGWAEFATSIGTSDCATKMVEHKGVSANRKRTHLSRLVRDATSLVAGDWPTPATLTTQINIRKKDDNNSGPQLTESYGSYFIQSTHKVRVPKLSKLPATN